MRCWWQRANANSQRHSRRSIACAQESRDPSRRPRATPGCGTRAIAGSPKTHLQHILTTVATNCLRVIEWLDGVPLAKTRTSRFAALAA